MLHTLRAAVDRCGYLDLISAFTTDPDPGKMRDFIDTEVGPDLADAVRLFHLADPVSSEAADRLTGGLCSQLTQAGLFQLNDGQVRTKNLKLRFVDGLVFFTGAPSARFPLYFGDDSLGLLRRQRIRQGERGLDLCTGTGVQALKLALAGGVVTGVDINPFAIQVARLNAEFNGVSAKVEFRRGDLWAGLKDGERFDWICANPPMVPALPGGLYPLVGDGGDDGLEITWRFLAGLPGALAENGQAITLGVAWSDGVLPQCLDRMRIVADEQDLNIRMTITRTLDARPGSGWYEALKQTYLGATAMDEAQVTQALGEQLDRNQATHSVMYFLNVTRASRGSLTLADLSPFRSQRLWDI
ncbi:MAG: release factor glutamine methyltransferase [Brevundimonas sp.]|jgi:release factor glutamine methyltransferase|uniref:methyltransferase n=1 Tax=Brevundimonas sp. TaxID=1871086 RepID=UPI0039E614CD